MTLPEQHGVPAQFPSLRRREVFSASPHGVGTQCGMHPEDQPYWTDERPPMRQRASQAHPVAYITADEEQDEYEDEDAIYDTRPHTSVRRYQALQRATPNTVMRVHVGHVRQTPPIYRRASATSRTHTQDRQPASPAAPPAPQQGYPVRTRARVHWSLSVGIGMLIMLLGWIGVSSALRWWQITQDDWHYGRPRTYQTDARVGHHDSVTPSHFTAWNLNRHVVIVEFPGDDPNHSVVYVGPTLLGPEQDLAPVTLRFQDVNGDGKPDMLVTTEGGRFVFINDAEKFRPQTPNDHITS